MGDLLIGVYARETRCDTAESGYVDAKFDEVPDLHLTHYTFEDFGASRNTRRQLHESNHDINSVTNHDIEMSCRRHGEDRVGTTETRQLRLLFE
jgi:hypothetical protein